MIEDYSLKEVKIGKWIDGSNLYKKTIVVTNTALSNGVNEIPHGIDNLKFCVKAELLKNGGPQFPYINITPNNALNTGTFLSGVDSTNITIRIFNDSWGAQNIWYITLYYIKN